MREEGSEEVSLERCVCVYVCVTGLSPVAPPCTVSALSLHPPKPFLCLARLTPSIQVETYLEWAAQSKDERSEAADRALARQMQVAAEKAKAARTLASEEDLEEQVGVDMCGVW